MSHKETLGMIGRDQRKRERRMAFESVNIGDEISFEYNNRKVRGIVHSQSDYGFVLCLASDYIGKNVEWFSGEYKDFSKANCIKLKVISKNNS